MRKFNILMVSAIISLSTITASAATIPRETLPLNATEEQVQIVETLIGDILDEVQADKLGYTLAAGYANTRIRKAVIAHQTSGQGYGILSPIAQNAIRYYRDLLLRPDYYIQTEEKLNVLLADLITEVQNGKDYNIAYDEARIKIYKSVDTSFNPDTDMVGDFCWLNGQTNGYSYGELVDIANAAIWQYRDMHLRPDFYANNLEKVRVIIAPIIEDYKSRKITYAEAEFNARNKIYQSVKPDFDPDVEYMKDPLSRDIPSVDNSLFIIARRLLLNTK